MWLLLFISLLIFDFWFLNSDEDMQSMASLMSTNNNSDIAPLDDFDEDEDIEGNYISVDVTLL